MQVIAVGIIFTTAFGSHCSYEYTVDHMLGFFEQLAFQAILSLSLTNHLTVTAAAHVASGLRPLVVL